MRYHRPAGHLRDPNNQIVVVKGLRISVTGVSTQSALSTELHRLLSQAVSTCQPPDGPAANVITAGDYDLNISGESDRGRGRREREVRSF